MRNDRFQTPSMPPEGAVSYRLYFLDGLGRIRMSHEFLAADDAVAIRIAEGWRESRRLELWQQARMVKRWD